MRPYFSRAFPLTSSAGLENILLVSLTWLLKYLIHYFTNLNNKFTSWSLVSRELEKQKRPSRMQIRNRPFVLLVLAGPYFMAVDSAAMTVLENDLRVMFVKQLKALLYRALKVMQTYQRSATCEGEQSKSGTVTGTTHCLYLASRNRPQGFTRACSWQEVWWHHHHYLDSTV